MADPIAAEPSAWERIKTWLRSRKTPEQEEADRQDALTAMHEALPDDLSARKAVLFAKKRRDDMIESAFK